jgi:hypothetical protein
MGAGGPGRSEGEHSRPEGGEHRVVTRDSGSVEAVEVGNDRRRWAPIFGGGFGMADTDAEEEPVWMAILELVIPVATTSDSVAARAARTGSSCPVGDPPTHSAPNPSASINCAVSGETSPARCQIPNLPRSISATSRCSTIPAAGAGGIALASGSRACVIA